MNATMKTTPATKANQIRLSKVSPAYWRVTFENPPLNLMGPDFVKEFGKVMTAIETDEHLRVVVCDSAVDGFLLNHSDFTVKLEELTSLPKDLLGLKRGPTYSCGLHARLSCPSPKFEGGRRETAVNSVWRVT